MGEREKKRGGRGRREEEEGEPSQKGMELGFLVWKLTLIMNPMRFGMDLWLCRIIIFPKHGVLLGFHLKPKNDSK